MNLDLSNLRKYVNILKGVLEKGNAQTESIYFNFKDDYCYLTGNNVYCRVKYNRLENSNKTEDDKETIKNFYVDGNVFLSIIEDYPELELNDNKFSKDKNIFEISITEGDLSSPNYLEKNELLDITDNFITYLREAINYVDNRDGSNLNAIFVKYNSIISTDKKRMYEIELDNKVRDYTLSINLLKTIFSFNSVNNIKLYKNENTMLLESDDIQFIFPIIENLSLPDVKNPSFIKNYDHKTYISLNKLDFKKELDFLFKVANSENNYKVIFTVEKDILIMEIKESYASIKKEISIIEKDDSLDNTKFCINCFDIRNLLNYFNKDIIKIQIPTNDNVPAINFKEEDSDKKHILLCRMPL